MPKAVRRPPKRSGASKGKGLDHLIWSALERGLVKAFTKKKSDASQATPKQASRPSGPTSRPTSPARELDPIIRLEKLAKLKEKGHITHDEYNHHKSIILGMPHTPSPSPASPTSRPSTPNPTKTEMILKQGSGPILKEGPPIETTYPEKKKEPKPYQVLTLDPNEPAKYSDSYGNIKHPKYKLGRVFVHSADPHQGKVKYVTTVDKRKGHPIVQPVNNKGEDVKSAFQANPKNLTEYED